MAIDVGGTLHCTATGNIIATTNELKDPKFNKTQQELNQQFSSDISNNQNIFYKYQLTTTLDIPAVDKTNENPQGWSNSIPPSTVNGFVWMISAIYTNNVFSGQWSEPIRLTGVKGKDGATGSTPIVTITRMVYKASTLQDTPARPTGGQYNSADNTFTPPEGWSNDPEITGDYVYMSTGNFLSSTGELKGAWSFPIRISGIDGSGSDGESVQFVYKLLKAQDDNQEVPESQDNDAWIPDGWTDHPSGVSTEFQYEYVSSRVKKGGHWQAFTKPSLWSKWSVNGMDGDGVEYIYQRTKQGLAPDVPKDSQNVDDYVPEGWTDNPTGVTSEFQYEWVCIRKYTKQTVDADHKEWGAFQGSKEDPTKAALWATYQLGQKGDQGNTGNHIQIMYAKTEGPSKRPVFVEDNENPGSAWGYVMPDHNESEAVWGIQAELTYDNHFAHTYDDKGNVTGKTKWEGPILLTGVPGTSITPNYKTYVYKKSDTRPDKPAADIPEGQLPEGWVDYPDSVGNWWQCIGSVNGTTHIIETWSEVLNVNGKDGVAQDGTFIEMRFILGDYDTAPTIDKANRNPNGWTVQPPAVVDGKALWMSSARINPDGATLKSNWTDPVRISGERGPQGNTGPAGPAGPSGSQGASGIPGVAIELRYSLGTDKVADGGTPTGREPVGWTIAVPSVTTDKPYIWFIQARYNPATNALEGDWSTPSRLTGLNGLNGTPGKSGQIIYPAGVYAMDKAYTTDDYKAPYVLDSSDANFYVLNSKMTWKGTEQNNQTPSQDYATNKGKYWLKFEGFEAVYAKIGIIANGLIGSAVFNKQFMFSQTGINPKDNNSITTHFENFDPNHIYDGTFTPLILFDLQEGSGNLGTGLKWDNAGNVTGDFFDRSRGTNNTYTLPTIPAGYTKTVNIPFQNLDASKLLSITVKTQTKDTKIVTMKSPSAPEPVEFSNNATIQAPMIGLGQFICNGYLDSDNKEVWNVGYMYYTPINLVDTVNIKTTCDYQNGITVSLESVRDYNISIHISGESIQDYILQSFQSDQVISKGNKQITYKCPGNSDSVRSLNISASTEKDDVVFTYSNIDYTGIKGTYKQIQYFNVAADQGYPCFKNYQIQVKLPEAVQSPVEMVFEGNYNRWSQQTSGSCVNQSDYRFNETFRLIQGQTESTLSEPFQVDRSNNFPLIKVTSVKLTAQLQTKPNIFTLPYINNVE